MPAAGTHEDSSTSMNRINRIFENRRSRAPPPRWAKPPRNEPHAHPLARVQDAKNAKDA
jgi:hypothetical protein